MSAITAKASRKMKKYAVLTREPRCFLGSFDFSWEQRKAKEICSIGTGKSNTQDQVDDGKYPFYIRSDVPVRSNKYLYDCEAVITIGDGNIGKVFHYVNGKFDLHQRCYKMTDFKDIWGKYFFYYFSTKFYDRAMKMTAKATVDSVRLEMISEMDIKKPPQISEQKQIAEFFANLDNLITLHQRKCANLCSPSQVVFSLLFATSTFSWEQRKLGDVGETYTGLSGKTKADFGHGQARFITYMNVFSNPISNPEMTEPIEIDPKQNEVEVGDVFFTTSSETPEEVGMSSVLFEKRGKIYLNSFCFGFRPTEKIDSYYLAYMLRSESAREKIILLAQGISRYNISKNKVMEIAVSLPSLDEQKLIGQYFRQLDNLITLHQRECISFTGRADRLILTANKKRTTSSWEQRKLGELVDRVVRKNTNNESTLPLTISAQYGLVDQITYFNNRVASRDVSNYYLVLNGEFAYNKSTSDGYPFGAVKRLDLYEKGVLSTLYIVFAPKKEQQIDSDYLTVFFDTDRWHKGVAERAAEGARNHGLLNISAEDFFDIDLSVPKDIVEQKQIGAFIRQLDNLITLHQRECISFTARAGRRILTANKKRNTSSWEQRKFSDVVATRRGLTYKPSDIRKNGVRVLRSSNIAEDSFVLSDEDVFVVREAVNIDCVRANDILITAANGSSRLVGKHTIISGIPEESAVHGGFMLLGTTKEPHFVNASMGSSWYRRFIELFVAGGNGAIGNLNKNDLDNQDIAIPSEKEQKKIGSFFRQLDNLITLHQRKPFLMKWRTSDANRNKTNRLVL